MQRGKAILWKRTAPLALVTATALLLSACGGSDSNANSSSSTTTSTTSSASSSTSASSTAGSSTGTESSASDTASSESAAVPTIVVPDGDRVGVSLITKSSNNPFFIALNEAAVAEGDKIGADITLTAGKTDGDEDTQIQAIEAAVARGDKGILITTNGPGINPALEKAKEAGLIIIALDTPLEPSSLADMTFASNNFTAGTLTGKWAAAQLNGEKATIALLDLFNDKIVSLDHQRDQGFLTGMGIDTKDDTVNGDEDPTGTYSGGKGGEYEIVCNEPTGGTNDGGKTAMELCISKNPDINVVHTINEPAAEGAYGALSANGGSAIVGSIDGGCGGIKDVADGVIGATALQYPSRMASYGVDTVVALARGGEAPAFSPGLDFFDTGLTLVTDKPVDGLDSITSAEAASVCWG